MNEHPAGIHLSVEELTDYFASDLPPERLEALNLHLAECGSCSQLGRQVYTSTLLLDRWSKASERRTVSPRAAKARTLSLSEQTVDETTADALLPTRNPPSSWKLHRNKLGERLKLLLSGSSFVPRYAFAILALIFVAGWTAQFAYQEMRLAALKQELNQQKATRASLSQESYQPETRKRLIPDDAIHRGEQNLEEPTILLSQGSLLVTVQLPAGAAKFDSFRAVLEHLERQQEILDGNLLKPSPSDTGPIVIFSFPATYLEDSRDYVVDLQGRTSSGSLDRVNTFTFHVVRQ